MLQELPMTPAEVNRRLEAEFPRMLQEALGTAEFLVEWTGPRDLPGIIVGDGPVTDWIEAPFKVLSRKFPAVTGSVQFPCPFNPTEEQVTSILKGVVSLIKSQLDTLATPAESERAYEPVS